MINPHVLVFQLGHRQGGADRVADLPSVEAIVGEFVGDVGEQGAFFVVGDGEVFDEEGPDLPALGRVEFFEADCYVDAGDEGFVDVARAVGGQLMGQKCRVQEGSGFLRKGYRRNIRVLGGKSRPRHSA